MSQETRDGKTVKVINQKRKKFSQAEKKQYAIAMKAYADRERKEVEVKRFVDSQTNQAISYSGTVYNLLEPAQGDGVDERIGDVVTAKSILLRYQINHADSTNTMRIIVFKYMAPGTPSPSTILESTATTGASLEPINWENRRDIRVLYDNLIASSTYTNATTVEKAYIKRIGKVQFDPAATTSQWGGLFLLAISDSSTVSHPLITFRSSVKYIDS